MCGRDGRTICGPLCVPKSTYVTLAHKRKQKFFYFGCSLVRRFYCKKVNKNNNGTDGQTDGQTDRQTDRQSATQYAAPSLRRVFWCLPARCSKRGIRYGNVAGWLGVRHTLLFDSGTWGKLTIFDGNSRLSRKRCKIGRWLLWNVNRKSEVPDWMG